MTQETQKDGSKTKQQEREREKEGERYGKRSTNFSFSSFPLVACRYKTNSGEGLLSYINICLYWKEGAQGKATVGKIGNRK